MSRRKGSTGTPATVALERARIPHTLHTYDHDDAAPSWGMEAAVALGREPGEVFKTLLVDIGQGLAVAVVPVDRQVDLKAVAALLGVKKATLADPARAQRSSGMVVGGISPIGQKTALPTLLDESMRALPSVLVSGGRRGLDIELAPADLARLTDARFAPISR